MKKISRRSFLQVAGVSAAALGLAACGGSASSAPASQAGNSAPAADEKTTFKIGMVTDVGGVNDKSFNQTSWEGLQALAASDSRFEVAYLESKNDADYGPNIETFVDDGCDLIISVGFMLADATRAAAEEYPEQKFAIIDDSSIDLPNVACLMFAQHEASYLVGIVAGMMTESNVVGYVQGMVYDAMNLFGVGFIAGVKSVNADATVLQYNANNFGDAAGGKTAAVGFISNGADVIYHAAGGTGNGVIEACTENDIWAIGVDSDQSVIDPAHVITSAMKRVDTASQDISKAVAEGTFAAGVHMYDLTNEGVGIAPTRDLLPDEVIAAVEQAMADIKDGKIVVPQNGDELAAALGEDLFTLDNNA